MNARNVKKVVKYVDDSGTILNLIRTSWSMLELYSNKILWRGLLLKDFESSRFLYEEVPLMELNWYVELKLLHTICNRYKYREMEYFSIPNPSCFIDNPYMMNVFLRHKNKIFRKWEYTTSVINHHYEEAGESVILYDTKRLTWVHHTRHIGFHSGANKNTNDDDSDLIRSFMVIPSYLFYHRILLVFGHPLPLSSVLIDTVWAFRLVHRDSGTIVNFLDYRCGVRFTYLKGSLENGVFWQDLIELLNFIVHPFFTYDISGACFFNPFSYRKILQESFEHLHSALSSVNLCAQSTQFSLLHSCNARSHKIETETYYVKSCNIYCNPSSSKHSIDIRTGLEIQKDISNCWHITQRIPNQMNRIIYNSQNHNWYIVINSNEEAASIQYKSLTNPPQIFSQIHTEMRELIPSALALYRLLCIFPSAHQRQYFPPYIWNIRLAHNFTGRIIEFSDFDGTLTIFLLNEEDEERQELESNIDASATENVSNNQLERSSSGMLQSFYDDTAILLNHLIGDTVLHPIGVISGQIA